MSGKSVKATQKSVTLSLRPGTNVKWKCHPVIFPCQNRRAVSFPCRRFVPKVPTWQFSGAKLPTKTRRPDGWNAAQKSVGCARRYPYVRLPLACNSGCFWRFFVFPKKVLTWPARVRYCGHRIGGNQDLPRRRTTPTEKLMDYSGHAKPVLLSPDLHKILKSEAVASGKTLKECVETRLRQSLAAEAKRYPAHSPAAAGTTK